MQKFTYTVKIYDPERRSKFVQRNLHGICHKFESVKALRCALYHELESDIPDGDYNVGYFEGSQHKKKWLVSAADLQAMYAHFKGRKEIPLWCDGKGSAPDSEDDEQPRKKKRKKSTNKDNTKKTIDREEELESVFQSLRDKHGSKWSGPQYRLWARAIVSGVHDSDSQPPNAPMFTGGLQKKPKESLTDAFTSAATAIVNALTPKQENVAAMEHSVRCSPGKKVDIRMRNLEQLRFLQSLREDGTLSEEEFTEQKRIVLQSLNNLA